MCKAFLGEFVQTELEDFADAEIIELADEFVGDGVAFVAIAVTAFQSPEMFADPAVTESQRSWEVFIETCFSDFKISRAGLRLWCASRIG